LLDADELSFEDTVKRSAVAKMKAHIRAAKTHAENYLIDHKDSVLNADEIAAVHLYTQESQFYKDLNRLLRERNRAALQPFLPCVSFHLCQFWLVEAFVFFCICLCLLFRTCTLV
jgi:hypothetical protein